MVRFKELKEWGLNTDNRTYVIAEIGINHNGDVKEALKMISAAERAGADAVKFQTYITEKRTFKGSPIFDILKRCELSNIDFKLLKEHSDNLGIEFFSTPFDDESVDFLDSIGCNLYKIASFDITNLKLVDKIAKTKKPIIMSTGMSNLDEVTNAINVILNNHNHNITLLHCISAYPTDEKDANLSSIFSLYNSFPNSAVIGQSDHTDDIIVPLCAVAAGAQVIEKHFMLNDTKCPDKPVSINQFQMRNLVEEIRRVETIFGDSEFGMSDAEAGTLQYRRLTSLD